MEKIHTTGWKRMEFVNFYSGTWGVPVIPIGEDKAPRLDKWTPYQTTMPTEEELDEWFVKQRAWGLAIICQHRLFSVDLDTEEIYHMLKRARAFPEGACIYKTAKGCHVIMRAKGELYSISQHSKQLTDIDPVFHELGINATNRLSIMPDTPQREWLELYAKPAEVNYVEWLDKYLGWAKRFAGKKGSDGWEEMILCPWHENDGLPHAPSLHLNRRDAGFYCHGCGRKGKLSELVKYCNTINYRLPRWVKEREKAYIGNDESQDFVHLASEPVTDKEMPGCMIEGIAYQQDIIELYAQSGIGKTSYATSLAADLALGRDTYGRWKVTKPYRILYIDLENPEGETRLAVQKAIGGNKEAQARVAIAELTGQGFDIFDGRWRQWLNDTIMRTKPDVIVGDNLSKMSTVDIVKGIEMKKVLGILRPICRKHNVLFILIHHAGWAQYDQQGRELPQHSRGASEIRDDVNVDIEIRRATEKDVTVMTFKKIRSRRASITVGDQFKHWYDHETMRLFPVEGESGHINALVDMLKEADGQMTKAELCERLRQKLSMARSQSYKVIDQAEQEGLIVVRGERGRGKKQAVFLSQDSVDNDFLSKKHLDSSSTERDLGI